MDGSRIAGRVVAAGGFLRRLHAHRVSPQQRLHLAALLIALAALPLHAADDHISFDPAITKAQFSKFSRIIAQGVYADPVQPARASGIIHFDVGIAATVVDVDETADYWKNAVKRSITTNGYVGVPRLVVAKGFGAGTISGSYAKLTDSGIKTYGGALDLPIVRGGVAAPELALRTSYARITGTDVFRLKTYGVEAFLSKGFGPITPYAAVGRMYTNARGTIPASAKNPEITLKDSGSTNRYTVGVRISLFVPKLVVEATQAEVRSYSAKISMGF